jgi:hypothetical protein
MFDVVAALVVRSESTLSQFVVPLGEYREAAVRGVSVARGDATSEPSWSTATAEAGAASAVTARPARTIFLMVVRLGRNGLTRPAPSC